MRVDNSRHIVDTAHRRSEYIRAKAGQACPLSAGAGEPITFETVTKRAGVSRLRLYANRTFRGPGAAACR